MLDGIMGFVSDNTGLLVGGGTAGMVLWVLKKVPNKEIQISVFVTLIFGAELIKPANSKIAADIIIAKSGA